MSARALLLLSALAAIPACDSPAPVDAPTTDDVPELDAPGLDAGADAPDAADLDAPAVDVPALDAPTLDAPATDAGGVDAPTMPDAPAMPDAPTMPDVPATPSVVSVAAGRIVSEGTGTTTTGSVLLTVSPASPIDATVRILTTPGTASSPGDYRFLSDTVAIPRGATSVMAPFEVVADAIDELDEQFEVMLIDPVGVTIGTATGTVTIADDDTADVWLTSAMPSAAEGNAPTGGSVSFELHREASPVPTTVGVRVRSGVGPSAATLGTDFEPLLGTTWMLPAGDVTGISFSVVLRGDGIGEPDETFVAEIFSVSGAELGTPSSLTLTIRNDDPPTISGCTTTSTVESATGRHTFRITSAIPMVAGVNVGYLYGGTASHGPDYTRVSPTASTGSVPFPAGATSIDFTIDTRDDVTDEPDETVTLTLLSVSPAATLDASCTVSTLSIEDDD